MSNVQRSKLAPDVEKRLRALAADENEKVVARARAVLRSYESVDPVTIGAELNMSEAGVRYWVKQFRSKGVNALNGEAPDPALDADTSAPIATPDAVPQIEVAPEEQRPVVEAAPAVDEKPRRGRKPRAPVPEVATEPVQESLPGPALAAAPDVPPEVETPTPAAEAVAERPRRGRKPKAAEPEPVAEPEKPRRGRKPKAAPMAETVPDLVQETLPDALAPQSEAPEPVAERPRRGRKPKAAPGPAAAAAPDVPPEVETPTPAAEAVAEKPRRGRKPKAAPVTKFEPTALPPIIELLTESEPEPEPLPPPEPPITTVRGLVDKYGVNLDHARYVTDLAYRLFDATAEIHRLPDHERRLLEAGALLHGIADDLDPDNHQMRARDIILETPLEQFTANEKVMVALLAAFHRRRVRPERDAAFAELPETLQNDTLALAALLRIADGLDGSGAHSTQIDSATFDDHDLTILLTGDQAETDAVRAYAKADLWERVFGQRVTLEKVAEPGGDAPQIPILTAPPLMRDNMPDLVLTLDPSMSAERATRKLGLHFIDRADRLAAQVKAGDDRRLNAFARELDRVRGLVTLALPERNPADVDRLVRQLQDALIGYAIHDRALLIAEDADDPNAGVVAARMGSWLDLARVKLGAIDFELYAQTMEELRKAFVWDPDGDTGALITTLIAPTVWAQLAELRDVVERGQSVRDALVAARRLQDDLIYFRSLLGTETVQALDILAPFENYLSAIETVQVIMETLRTDEASAALRTTQEALLNEFADGLPSIWASVNSVTFRRSVALALATP